MVDLRDPITLQVLWNRLIFITDQADIAIGRTAFSPIVSEAHDYVTVLLDAEGNSLAQCSQSIPAFIGSLPLAAKHFLRAYPKEALSPGDVLVSNDPIIGTGHLPDVTVLTPIFREDRVVAFAGNIAHLPDVGGRPFSPDAGDFFEEGIRLPIIKLYKGGKPNQDLFEIIAASVRVPDEVVGDLQSLAAANDVMARELRAFMDEYDLDDLVALGRAIHDRSEDTMRKAIRLCPAGTYEAEVHLDGFDAAVTIKTTIQITDDHIRVDYAGSSPQVPFGINVYPHYRYAQTAYALKCLFDPLTPNNEGCFRPITDGAPLGSILNPQPPAAGNARMLVGHGIPGAIFKAMQHVLPDRVQAESGGAPIWGVTFVGHRQDNRLFAGLYFLNGGWGARGNLDGIDALSFPSNSKVTPVEMFEQTIPVLIEEKLLIPNSGGPGQYRGGLGQRVTFRNVSSGSIDVYLSTERLRHPCSGILGGREGRPGAVSINGTPTPGKGKISLTPGQRLTLETPGGGGLGRPALRSPDAAAKDLQQGLISMRQATEEYNYNGIEATAMRASTDTLKGITRK